MSCHSRHSLHQEACRGQKTSSLRRTEEERCRSQSRIQPSPHPVGLLSVFGDHALCSKANTPADPSHREVRILRELRQVPKSLIGVPHSRGVQRTASPCRSLQGREALGRNSTVSSVTRGRTTSLMYLLKSPTSATARPSQCTVIALPEYVIEELRAAKLVTEHSLTADFGLLPRTSSETGFGNRFPAGRPRIGSVQWTPTVVGRATSATGLNVAMNPGGGTTISGILRASTGSVMTMVPVR